MPHPRDGAHLNQVGVSVLMLDFGKIMIHKNNALLGEALTENAITKNEQQPPKVVYEVVGEPQPSGDSTCISYGIAAYIDAATSNTKNVIAHVRDVTTSRPEIENLVQKCNAFGLSPIHLVDVIEDFLNK